jgi:hypothetical protein
MFLKDVDGQVKRGCRAGDVVIAVVIDGKAGERFLVVAAEAGQLHAGRLGDGGANVEQSGE